MLKCCTCFTLSGSGGIMGGHGGKCPPSEALPPTCPPLRRKKWPKSAIFGKFLDFCPLRIAFCPLNAPLHKKISGAGTAFRPQHGSFLHNTEMNILKKFSAFLPFQPLPLLQLIINFRYFTMFTQHIRHEQA